jgi:hypothetical protein
MARGAFRAALRALASLVALWAAAQIGMGCDAIVGIHIINSDQQPAGGSGASPGTGGADDAGACSPEALSCAECAECHEVVDVILDDFGAPTSPALPLDGSTAGESRASARVTFECKQADGPERIHAVHIGQNGFLTAKLSRAGTEFDSVLYARKGCCFTSDPTTQCNDSRKFEGDHSSQGGEVISFRVAKGDVWYLFVDGSDSAAGGSYALDLNLTAGAGCAGQGWVPIAIDPGAPMKLSGDTPGRGSDGLNRCFLGHVDGVGTFSEVVYELRAPADVAAFDLSLNGTFDTVLYARSACVDSNVGDQSELTCIDDNSGVGGEFIQGLQNTGAPLYVFVDTGPISATSYEYTLTITPK